MEQEPVEGDEGATQRLSPLCPQCRGAMKEGRLLGTLPLEWAEGPRERSFKRSLVAWSRGLLRYHVTGYRCEQCGFLASYAITPIGD